MAAKRRGRTPQPVALFNRKLALNRWLLSLFGVERFDRAGAAGRRFWRFPSC